MGYKAVKSYDVFVVKDNEGNEIAEYASMEDARMVARGLNTGVFTLHDIDTLEV